MMVSIDKAGRVVIPKELRERFGLGPDAQLEIEASHTGIELRPVRPSKRRLVTGDDGFPLIEQGAEPVITDADVQRWRDSDQR